MILRKKFTKYMPTSNFPEKTGSALQISLSGSKEKDVHRACIEMVAQSKNKPPSGSTDSPFEWKNKVLLMLKEEEVGMLLALFRRRVDKVSIIHKYPIDAPPKDQRTTILNVEEKKNGNVINWQFRLKQTEGSESHDISIYLKPEDAEILTVLFQRYIEIMYGF